VSSARVEAEDANGDKRVLKKETSPPMDFWNPGPHPHARVGMQVGTQQNFGEVKITAYVEMECNQDAKSIDEAGLAAFTKAVEFMNDGLSLLAAGK
jgi:hypothetical protein